MFSTYVKVKLQKYKIGKKTTDNISSLRNGLNSLIKRTTENEIAIKPADKGSIITVMSPEFYFNICESHLRNEEYYECIQIMTLLFYLKTK